MNSRRYRLLYPLQGIESWQIRDTSYVQPKYKLQISQHKRQSYAVMNKLAKYS